MDTRYTHKVGRNLFLVFVLLAYIALNYASNGMLVKLTITVLYNAASLVLPLVPLHEFVNPYAL